MKICFDTSVGINAFSKQNVSYLSSGITIYRCCTFAETASQSAKKKRKNALVKPASPESAKEKRKNAEVKPASSQSAILSQTCTFDAELCGQNIFKSGLKCWRGFINPYSQRTLITLIISSYNVISQAARTLSPPRSSSFSRRACFWTPTWLWECLNVWMFISR